MLIIGHRGAKGLAPENTLASLQAALDHHVDGIEFDVRVTKDDVPVLHHNSDVGIKGNDLDIAKTNYADLKVAKPDMITLDEALDFINNRTTIVVEIKIVRTTKPIIESLKAHIDKSWDAENISVSSFIMRYLQDIKRELPDIHLIVNEGWSGVRATNRARKLGTKSITMNQRWLWGYFVRSMSKGGYKLSAYTINNPQQAKTWQKHGLYAAITDYPDRFTK